MIWQDFRAPNISIELEIFWGGGRVGGPDPLHRKSQVQWKIWSSGILANHSFFAHPPGSACLFTYKHTDSRVHRVHLRQH